MNEAHTLLSATDLDEAERRVLAAAVAEALADPRPDIPHEEVRAEILADIEALERELAASLDATADALERNGPVPPVEVHRALLAAMESGQDAG